MKKASSRTKGSQKQTSHKKNKLFLTQLASCTKDNDTVIATSREFATKTAKEATENSPNRSAHKLIATKQNPSLQTGDTDIQSVKDSFSAQAKGTVATSELASDLNQKEKVNLSVDKTSKDTGDNNKQFKKAGTADLLKGTTITSETPNLKQEEGTPLINNISQVNTREILPNTGEDNTFKTDTANLSLRANKDNNNKNVVTSRADPLLAAKDSSNKETKMSSGTSSQQATKKAVIDQIYDQFKELFKPSDENQVMVMEFPGRVLDESVYHFDSDKSLYSNILKPQVVMEEEFRLTNDIFDVNLSSPNSSGYIVGGPSGKNVSTEFNEALSTLIPKFTDFESLFKDRQIMRNWLLEEIKDEIDEKEFKGSRIAFYDILSQRYETAKSEWETERLKRMEVAESASNRNEALEEYAKWLSFNAGPQEAKLESLFSDLVVRGYYHEIKRILGYIDVASPAEILEDVKSKMRESSMLSLDESETIYPVQMMPVNWSKSLSTNFKPEDLLLSPGTINDDLMNKLSEKAELESQIQQLQNQPTGDLTQIEEKVRAAQKAQDNATKDMLSNYTEATFLALKIAYNAYCKKNDKKPNDESVVDALKKDDLKNDEGKEELSNGHTLSDKDIEAFKDFQKKNIAAQISLDSANREYAFELEEKAKAESTESKSAITLLQSQLAQLNIAINNLKKIALSTGNTDAQKILPDSRPKVNEFIDVTFKFNKNEASSSSELTSSSSFSNTSVNFIFGSYGNSSSEEASDFNQKHQTNNIDIEIGMRATKVTINRGGWFSPEVLEASKNMFRTGEGKFNDSFQTYPVAFIVVKDVTLKYTFEETEVDQAAKYAHSASESSGGFLCFSHSSGSSSSKNSKSAYTGKEGKSVVIRIPGPQILMWILEKVPSDQSEPYPSGASAFPPGVADIFKPNEKKEDNE